MRIYYEKIDEKLNTKAQHNAAYDLLHRVLYECYGLDNADIQKTPEGKPYIAGSTVKISLSHTSGLVCCAVAEGKEIGIDCERIRSVSKHVPKRVCTEKELSDILNSKNPDYRFLMYWTLKESISKKRGVGLRESFLQYEILWDDDRPMCKGYELQIKQVDDFFIAAAE